MSSDDFYDAMFEVSNEERVNIMRALTREKTSFSGLARNLGITTQEVSRHFNRLVESGIATRSIDGYPALTAYGFILLRQLKSIKFTTQNKEYFMTHDASTLTNKFLDRFGELAGINYTDDIMVAIHNIIRIIQEAEDYILDINLPYIASGFPHIKAAYDRGVKGYFLRGTDLKVPNEMLDIRQEVLPEEYMDYIRREELLKDKFLEVDIILYMNEKEIALLSFPTINGNYDYRGFTGTDKEALEWCRDMFYHYWDRGKKGPLVTDSYPS
jgi:predicted transcriptional regulator